jgi:hypothetical protein
MHGKREGMMTVPGIKDRVIETKVTVEGIGRYRISLPRSTAEATQILRRRPGSGRVLLSEQRTRSGLGQGLSTTALV